MDIELTKMLDRSGDKVRAVLNILIESPCFYASDRQELFYFLRRHRREFNDFFDKMYGWQLLMDAKCARVYKGEWHNPAITPANRAMFNFSRRDECLAFMMLLEFFEQQLEENGMTVEDQHNLRFHFGDLLHHIHRRFQEIFPGDAERYSEEYVRAKALKPIMPELEKYRFIKRIQPPEDLVALADEVIYEALPALYHYNSAALSRMLPELQREEQI
ncbi:MAG: DUF2398 family protein [Proteobacteria bacterium]|nr:DUF2398 family protein [Pseudomonadota bacterium]MBU1060085.1 DUF2398 family protein [Pseudomonadota bacterium]